MASATKTFTADKSGNGTVELTFTVDASKLAGERLVAFETCTYKNAEVAVHADITDADQTVDVSQPEEIAVSSEALWPAKIGAAYQHTDAGDFLTFMEVPDCGRPTETIEITGQLVDGYCTGEYYYSVPGSTVTYELQVHPDGSYDISVRDDYLSWTNHDPPWPPEDCEPDAIGIPIEP